MGFKAALPAQCAAAVMSLSVCVCVCACDRVCVCVFFPALTLEVELLVSLLIGFAVPAVPAQEGGREKKATESADCAAKGGRKDRKRKNEN